MNNAPLRGILFHGIGRPKRELEPGESRFWITVDSFHAILDEITKRPDVRITFDDGNASDLDVALAALLERRLVATFFVVASRIGSRGSVDAEGLRELRRHGMTIGTHGMDHRPWRRLPPAAREREFVEARERISDVVGSAVDEAAVPLGLYDRRSLTELKRLGYTAVHTSERMVGKVGEWLQPRFSVRAYDTVQTMKSDALADPARVQRAWLVAKSHVKRLR